MSIVAFIYKKIDAANIQRISELANKIQIKMKMKSFISEDSGTVPLCAIYTRRAGHRL